MPTVEGRSVTVQNRQETWHAQCKPGLAQLAPPRGCGRAAMEFQRVEPRASRCSPGFWLAPRVLVRLLLQLHFSRKGHTPIDTRVSVCNFYALKGQSWMLVGYWRLAGETRVSVKGVPALKRTHPAASAHVKHIGVLECFQGIGDRRTTRSEGLTT